MQFVYCRTVPGLRVANYLVAWWGENETRFVGRNLEVSILTGLTRSGLDGNESKVVVNRKGFCGTNRIGTRTGRVVESGCICVAVSKARSKKDERDVNGKTKRGSWVSCIVVGKIARGQKDSGQISMQVGTLKRGSGEWGLRG